MKDKIVLIGMPGCGKSTLGKLLAEELNLNFYDMDEYIEQKTNTSIPNLFEKGEEYFRDIESEVCVELMNKKNSLISSGGGVVKRNRNVQTLRENSIVIFIDRPVESIMSDIEISGRPLLKNGKDKLYSLYKERYELYCSAAHIKITNNISIEGVIEKCKNEINNKLEFKHR